MESNAYYFCGIEDQRFGCGMDNPSFWVNIETQLKRKENISKLGFLYTYFSGFKVMMT